MIYSSAQSLNRQVQKQYIKVKTIEWVRQNLSGIEFDVRMYSKSDATYANEVSAFIAAIDLRANDYMILNDDDSYSKGVLFLHKANLIDEDKCRQMLEIGHHDAFTLMGIPQVA